MADEEKTEEQAPEAGKSKKLSPILIVVVLIVIGFLLSGTIAYFITTQLVNTGGSVSGGEVKNHDPGVFVKLGDPKEGLIVNVGGIKASRFLKIGIVMELNPEKEEIVKEGKLVPMAETKIMDSTLQILRTIKIEELDANKQDDLKAKLKAEVNKALGEGSVFDVYITSFMLQ
ncbi:MAG: flagellar basal body-associated FliL family protein [Anaerovibrio sp.]|uniref:flagellar basal body-associated FliL family protein n=1 Tax=Anaerovibrio sp. TaxID=1872532 RepID=UPI0025EFE1B8|nr:flagellar basal body-associated FliL family protein [Anaerovibrio sp.]MCR5175912.1 flagellar basal body-associated FliL family protein [Anaerovibrio sp.]